MTIETTDFYKSIEEEWTIGLEKVINAKKFDANYCLTEDYRERLLICRNYFEEKIFEAETGMCLGVGWHGGQTSEEWKLQKEFSNRIISIIDKMLMI